MSQDLITPEGAGILEVEEAPSAPAGRRLLWLRWLLAVLAVAVLVIAPRFLSLYGLTVAFSLFNYATIAQAWNLIGGYGGQFSLGHALFVGVGSYSLAVLLLHTAAPLWLSILLSGLIATVIAAVAALPLLRLRSVYFAVGSLGIALAGTSWMINWTFTKQTEGLGLPTSKATLDFGQLYYLAAALVVASTITAAVLVRGRFGLRLMAIRDDEDAAAELGVDAFRVKLAAFTISAFFTGLAGALVALQKVQIEPVSAFSLNWTINMINMTVIGGLATLSGPFVGAVIVYGIQQLLQSYGSLATLISGILLIVIISVAPGGLVRAVRGQGLRVIRFSR